MYREPQTPTTAPPPPRPWWGARLWRRLFGELVYTGEHTCGHCTFWTPGPPVAVICKDRSCCSYRYHTKPGKGDCKLIHGERDKWAHESCDGDDRFQPKRTYMHRVKRHSV